MILKRISPRTTSGSLILAGAAHALVYGAIFICFALGSRHGNEEIVPVTEDLSYQTFDAPPLPKDAPMPKPPVVDNSPKELQDKDSTVAGTQKEKPAAPAVAAAQSVANVPYYKIKPKYPRAALAAGIEGWIELKIDVDDQGTVGNVRVTGGEQKSLFQDEARRAVEKWKYKPFLDANGKPMKKTDHIVRVDFKLRDAV